MPVTELAILHLPPKNRPPTKALLANLDKAKISMESYSGGFPFLYFRTDNDTDTLDNNGSGGGGDTVYILGGWPSIDFHVNAWLPSEENAVLLKSLQGEVEVREMFHVDGCVDEDGDGVVGRFLDGWVDGGVDFVRCFLGKERNRKGIERVVKNGDGKRVAGGWRVDGMEEGRAEFVLFVGWESGEAYDAAVGRDGKGALYRSLEEYCDRVEVRRARLLDVSGGGS